MAQKWKIFTNKERTRFIAARKGSSAVYDGPSEVEALRAILDAAISVEVEPVERAWAEQPAGTLPGQKDYKGRWWRRYGAVHSSNWHPSKYADNKKQADE
jgi:hypothetical protein